MERPEITLEALRDFAYVNEDTKFDILNTNT